MRLLAFFLTMFLFYQAPSGNIQLAWVPVVLAAVSAASTIYQIYQARQQEKEAKSLRDQERPQFQTPHSARAALNAARLNASRRGFPGQDAAEASLKESSADTFERIKQTSTSPSQAIAAVGELGAAEMSKKRDFAQMGADYQAGATRDLVAANQFQSGIDQFAWMKNEHEPFMQDQLAASALQGAAQQNYFGALNNVSNMAMMGLYASGSLDYRNRNNRNTVPKRNL